MTGLEALLSRWGTGDNEDTPHADSPGRFARVLSDYYRTMQRIIFKAGGSIARIDPYKGSSKMLILFGAPVAHEDDPQRAVRAALEMRTELETLNRRWRQELADQLPPEIEGPPLQQRIGITLGSTFAGQAGSATRREYTVMGDDVNLAARLMAAAQADQILISQRVCQAVQDLFRLTPLPPIRVKGKSDLIPLYQVDSPVTDRLSRRLASRGPLLGREEELSRCTQVLLQALDGRGSQLSIHGPAGIGKSHLVDLLIREAVDRGAAAHLCEANSYSRVAPYSAWITLLNSMVEILPADLPETRAEKLERCLVELDLVGKKVREPLFRLLGLPAPAKTAAPSDQPAAPAREASAPSLFRLLEKRVDQAPAEGPTIWQLIRERQQDQAPSEGLSLGERIAGREQRRLQDAVGQFLQGMATTKPLVLVFEDAQWMDPMSWTLLEGLGQSLAAWPILILTVRRQEEGEVNHWPRPARPSP